MKEQEIRALVDLYIIALVQYFSCPCGYETNYLYAMELAVTGR